MLTYHYALISDPSHRTVDALLDYVRAHPRCLLTLPPADFRAMRRAIAIALGSEYAPDFEEVMLAIEGRAVI